MIQNLTRTDLVRLIRGCEPGMEHVNELQRCGLAYRYHRGHHLAGPRPRTDTEREGGITL